MSLLGESRPLDWRPDPLTGANLALTDVPYIWILVGRNMYDPNT